jgi:hypothetical protein
MLTLTAFAVWALAAFLAPQEKPAPPVPPPAPCLTIAEAARHRGSHQCVTGKVLKVGASSGGMTFLDFCEDYLACPFTVVIFPEDLRRLGDVNQLAGQTVQIHGKIEDYDGRAQIVLENAKQFAGESARLPKLLKGYDVEQHGHFSAGKFSHPGKSRRPHRRRPREEPPAVDVEQGPQ